jgi:hypothetical protein
MLARFLLGAGSLSAKLGSPSILKHILACLTVLEQKRKCRSGKSCITYRLCVGLIVPYWPDSLW